MMVSSWAKTDCMMEMMVNTRDLTANMLVKRVNMLGCWESKPGLMDYTPAN